MKRGCLISDWAVNQYLEVSLIVLLTQGVKIRLSLLAETMCQLLRPYAAIEAESAITPPKAQLHDHEGSYTSM